MATTWWIHDKPFVKPFSVLTIQCPDTIQCLDDFSHHDKIPTRGQQITRELRGWTRLTGAGLHTGELPWSARRRLCQERALLLTPRLSELRLDFPRTVNSLQSFPFPQTWSNSLRIGQLLIGSRNLGSDDCGFVVWRKDLGKFRTLLGSFRDPN